jgi:hypothetical protein
LLSLARRRCSTDRLRRPSRTVSRVDAAGPAPDSSRRASPAGPGAPAREVRGGDIPAPPGCFRAHGFSVLARVPGAMCVLGFRLPRIDGVPGLDKQSALLLHAVESPPEPAPRGAVISGNGIFSCPRRRNQRWVSASTRPQMARGWGGASHFSHPTPPGSEGGIPGEPVGSVRHGGIDLGVHAGRDHGTM